MGIRRGPYSSRATGVSPRPVCHISPAKNLEGSLARWRRCEFIYRRGSSSARRRNDDDVSLQPAPGSRKRVYPPRRKSPETVEQSDIVKRNRSGKSVESRKVECRNRTWRVESRTAESNGKSNGTESRTAESTEEVDSRTATSNGRVERKSRTAGPNDKIGKANGRVDRGG